MNLTKLKNPTFITNVTPTEMLIYSEELIVTEIGKTYPDYIVYIEEGPSEHGYSQFGEDFSHDIFELVRKCYEAAIQFDPIPSRPIQSNSIIILKKNRNACVPFTE